MAEENNGSTEGTPNGAGSGAGNESNNGAAPAAPWYGSLDADTVGWMENKGYKQDALTPDLAVKAIQGHRNIEKLMGVPADRLLKLPGDNAAPEEWDAVYSKLGRPGDAKDYEIAMPETGGDEQFADWAKGTFHELGLTKAQAAKLSEKWNEYAGTATQAQMEAFTQRTTAEINDLKTKEWGAAFEQNTATAKRAAQTFGVDQPTLDKMERAMGTAALMKLFHNIGSKMGEDTFHAGKGDNAFGGVYSPAAAKSKIAELQRDREWTARYLQGGKAELTEMRRLQEMANGR